MGDGPNFKPHVVWWGAHSALSPPHSHSPFHSQKFPSSLTKKQRLSSVHPLINNHPLLERSKLQTKQNKVQLHKGFVPFKLFKCLKLLHTTEESSYFTFLPQPHMIKEVYTKERKGISLAFECMLQERERERERERKRELH